MKILTVGSVYPRFEKDSEVPWLRASLQKLSQAGVQVCVLAPAYRGLCDHEIDGISVKRFRYAPAPWEILTHDEGAPNKMASKPWLQLLAIPYILSGTLKMFSLIRKEKPDVIHAHWPFPHGLIAYPCARFFRIPLVLNFHGAELLLIKKHRFVRPVLKFLIRRADAVLSNSHFTAKKIKEIFPREVIISPYGTTFSNRLEKKDKDKVGKFRVLFVGRHIERKGIAYLIEAAKELPPDRFEIRIVGEGDLTLALKKLAQKWKLSHVIFLGKLSSEALALEYALAHAFVLPAIVDSRGDTEGLGVVLIEAAENELPIVASPVGGISDVIVDCVTGLFAEEKNPKAIADAILRLEADEELAKSLSKNAKAKVREMFDWEKIIADQISLYENLIQKK